MTIPVLFNVTQLTPGTNADQLTGSTDGTILHIVSLTLRTTGTNTRRIKKSSTTGSILVSQAEFNTLPSSPPAQWSLTLNVTDDLDGWVTVESFVVNLGAQLAHFDSEIQALSGSTATLEEQLPHVASGDVIKELRALNRRIESIERLLLSERNGSGGGGDGELRATGTGPR